MEELIFKMQLIISWSRIFWISCSIKKCIGIEYALKEILFLAQGGTAVGTGINSKNFVRKLLKKSQNLLKRFLNLHQKICWTGCTRCNSKFFWNIKWCCCISENFKRYQIFRIWTSNWIRRINTTWKWTWLIL